MSRVKIHQTYSSHNFSCSHIELTSEIFSGLLGGGCHGLLESLTVMLLHIRKSISGKANVGRQNSFKS